MNIIAGAIFLLMQKRVESLKICGKELNACLKNEYEQKVKDKFNIIFSIIKKL